MFRKGFGVGEDFAFLELSTSWCVLVLWGMCSWISPASVCVKAGSTHCAGSVTAAVQGRTGRAARAQLPASAGQTALNGDRQT